MTPIATKWIEAGKSFASHPLAQVRCPECDKGWLRAFDVVVPGTSKMERYIFCESCGAKNVLLMKSGGTGDRL